MGFFKNLRDKRDLKRAQDLFELDHSAWVRDLNIILKMKKTFEAAAQGESLIDETMVNEPGEIALWSGEAQYHEATRGASQYVGGSSGVSVRIMKGVSYRVGAQRGTLVPGEVSQRILDSGVAYLTTHRLIFIGMHVTQEWKFSKWVGATATENEDDFLFMVSNRKKTSGLLMAPGTGREFNRFLALAIGYVENGVDEALKTITAYEEKVRKLEPKFVPPVRDVKSDRVEPKALPNAPAGEVTEQ